MAALFAALVAVGGLFALPFWGPVPFTLQVFFVLLAGLVLGPRLGALAVALYLLLGLVAPVYAQGTSGIGVLFGPTGGYLFGFVAAAALAGVLAGRGGGRLRLLLASVIALVPIYALGATWLAWQLRIEDLRTVLVEGVIPFVPVDLLKALAATLVATALVGLRLGLGVPASSR
ncbi:MAG TPA: biotin transporter BioY [Thermoleophilia bacterium]|nr:biotin transporter BioY [Thermoleophilia bacterium]